MTVYLITSARSLLFAQCYFIARSTHKQKRTSYNDINTYITNCKLICGFIRVSYTFNNYVVESQSPHHLSSALCYLQGEQVYNIFKYKIEFKLTKKRYIVIKTSPNLNKYIL